MITPKMKWVALILCLAYILVQTFQWWVFSQAPVDNDPLKLFLFDADPMSVLRSWLMLISMFALLFIHLVLCYEHHDKNRVASKMALAGFFTFFLLEVVLRSIELFYVQIELPEAYLRNPTVDKEAILLLVSQFRQVQSAVYFPLGISWMIASFLVGFIFPSAPKFNLLVKIAFWFNGIRIALRSGTVYLGLNILPDDLYSKLYLPMVFVVFGLTAAWLFLSVRKEHNYSNQ